MPLRYINFWNKLPFDILDKNIMNYVFGQKIITFLSIKFEKKKVMVLFGVIFSALEEYIWG